MIRCEILGLGFSLRFWINLFIDMVLDSAFRGSGIRTGRCQSFEFREETLLDLYLRQESTNNNFNYFVFRIQCLFLD